MPEATAAIKQRARAARALHGVLTKQRTLDQVEGEIPFEPFERQLLYGTLRFYFSLSYRAATLLKQPFKRRDQDLWALLLLGLYQLHHLSLPDHAVVASTAGAARYLRKPWATALINGCLRNAQRHRHAALATLPKKSPVTRAEAEHELPTWLLDELKADYPSDWQALTAALLTRAPLCLRLADPQNSAVTKALTAAGLRWQTPFEAETLIAEEARPVRQLPGHDTGALSVQDAGAQLGVQALEQLRRRLAEGEDPLRWADVCCAPGGKLFHVLERWRNEAQTVVALDVSERRMQQVAREQQRLTVPGSAQHLTLLTADARATASWCRGQDFDLLLLDAPCTGTGTLRRHPDIKLLRQHSDIDAQVALQHSLLNAVAAVVRPGGGLLYATCSLLRRENDGVIETFLAQAPGWQAVPLELASGTRTRLGWQLLPTDRHTDGFYYAALKHLN